MREMARKFFETECAPYHEQWEVDGMVSRGLWEAAGANGLLGIPMPEEYGGPGGNILQASIMWEEQGASGFTGPGFAIHSGVPGHGCICCCYCIAIAVVAVSPLLLFSPKKRVRCYEGGRRWYALVCSDLLASDGE